MVIGSFLLWDAQYRAIFQVADAYTLESTALATA